MVASPTSSGGGGGGALSSLGRATIAASAAAAIATAFSVPSHLIRIPRMAVMRRGEWSVLPRYSRPLLMSRHYELVLMLDPEAADGDRDKLAADVRGAIEQAGTLERADTWGVRKLAYEIRQRNEADYRYYRFQGENDLLERLDHNLKIADGALRFRIFQVDPDAPSNPPPTSDRPAAVGDGRPERGDRERRPRRED